LAIVDQDALKRGGPRKKDGCRGTQAGLIHVAVHAPQVKQRAQESALPNDLRHDADDREHGWSGRRSCLSVDVLPGSQGHRAATNAPQPAEATSQNTAQAGLPRASASAAAATAGQVPSKT